jgi:hypothetical protein
MGIVIARTHVENHHSIEIFQLCIREIGTMDILFGFEIVSVDIANGYEIYPSQYPSSRGRAPACASSLSVLALGQIPIFSPSTKMGIQGWEQRVTNRRRIRSPPSISQEIIIPTGPPPPRHCPQSSPVTALTTVRTRWPMSPQVRPDKGMIVRLGPIPFKASLLTTKSLPA